MRVRPLCICIPCVRFPLPPPPRIVSLLGQCTDVWGDDASANHVFIPWLPMLSKHPIGSHLVQVGMARGQERIPHCSLAHLHGLLGRAGHCARALCHVGIRLCVTLPP
jgi:hypothetical protein